MGIPFNEIEEETVYVSQSRTIRETDIVNFAGLSGDFNPLHTDEIWVKANTKYERTIAHGLLITAVSSGFRTPGLDDWLILAYLGIERKFKAPVYPGDTLFQRSRVVSVRRSNSNPKAAIVTVEANVLNQDDTVVQHGHDTYLVGSLTSEES